MLRQRVCLAFLLAISTTIAKPSGPSPWASYAGKPVYARSLGPPPGIAAGISSITVPYKPKSSPFFPKFVDPTMMIAKKTDMLSNFFGGPANYPSAAPAGSYGFYSATKPISYADESSSDLSGLEEIFGNEKTPSSELKRGIFGPVGPKFPPMGSKFGPMGPKFIPGSSPFVPFSPFGSKFGSFDGVDGSSSSEMTSNSMDSRRKRSITDTKAGTSGTPPPYPGLDPIAEESETELSNKFVPGMFASFGPFGPMSPFAPGPVVDPSIFISKKTSFLDTLFKNLATSTSPSPLIDTTTDIPVAKSTIVPPGYWAPTSIIPGPMEYTNKVSDFLDKLFDSLKLNKTTISPKIARSLISENDYPKTIVARSIDDFTTISAAKDAIVDSIIDELVSLKTDMVNTMNDFIAAQTSSVPISPFPPKPVKPSKTVKPGKPIKPTSPIKTAFASMWTPPPPVDTSLPFKQKMTVLSQVFDMLTGLQKNITLAIQDSIEKSTITTDTSSMADNDLNIVANPDIAAQLNATLLDAIKNKLSTLDSSEPVNPYFVGKYARALPIKSDSSLWGETIKREIDGNDDDNDNEDVYENEEHHNNNHDQFKRGVKMGYQKMPFGTFENLQAGTESVPGHQASGIKLFDQQENNFENSGEKWANWGNFMKSQYEGKRNHHHHNHH